MTNNTINKSKPDLLYPLLYPNSPDISSTSSDNTIQSRQKYSLTNEKCDSNQKTLRFCANFPQVNRYKEIRNDTLKNKKENLMETIQGNFHKEFSKMTPKQKTGILKIIYCCISGYWLHKEYPGEIFSIYSETIRKISWEHGKDLLEPFFIIDNNNFKKGTLTKKGQTMGYKYSEKLKRTIESYSLNENYIQQVSLNNKIKINVEQGISDAKLLIELIITGDFQKYNKIFKPRKDITSIDELKIRKNKLIMILENVNIDEYKPANCGREMLQSDSNLQMLNSELRNRLFSGLGDYDIDMVNSHYSLLWNWLNKEHFTDKELMYSIDPEYIYKEYTFFNHYVNNRAEVIGELSNKFDLTQSKVKELLLALLNNGLNNFKNSVFEDVYYPEIARILQDEFIVGLKIDINDIKDTVFYFFGAGKIERGKVLSDLLLKLESEVLNIICTEYSNNIILKMFDGWISNKQMNISEIEELVKEKTGFILKFKQIGL